MPGTRGKIQREVEKMLIRNEYDAAAMREAVGKRKHLGINLYLTCCFS
jgi:hypothetical protein